MGKFKKSHAMVNAAEANATDLLNETKKSSPTGKLKTTHGNKKKKMKLKKNITEHDALKKMKKKEKVHHKKKNEINKMESESFVDESVDESYLIDKKKKTGKKRKAPEGEELIEDKIESAKKEKKFKKRKTATDENNLIPEKSSTLDELSSENPTMKSKKKKKFLKTDKLLNESPDFKEKTKPKKKKSLTSIENDRFKENTERGLSETDENQNSRDARTVFVGNVPLKYHKKNLFKLFNEKGQVEKMWTRGIKPVSDKLSKKTALIANLLPEEHPPLVVYILYKTVSEAKNALQLNGTVFEDHRLRVTEIRMKRSAPDEGVFVGNLPFKSSEDELYDMFSKCGKIVSVRVVRDAKTGVGKGFGYVNFNSSDAVELALKLNEEKYNGREIRVQRQWGLRKVKKVQKSKEMQAMKEKIFGQKLKMKKKDGEFSQKKASDKFPKKKKKNYNITELKKKILAKKLTNTSKRKEKKTD